MSSISPKHISTFLVITPQNVIGGGVLASAATVVTGLSELSATLDKRTSYFKHSANIKFSFSPHITSFLLMLSLSLDLIEGSLKISLKR